MTIEGIVVEFQLVNPHPFLFIDVKGRTGEAQRWQLEMDNRRELVSIGVTASTFKPGDLVVVTGSLAGDPGKSCISSGSTAAQMAFGTSKSVQVREFALQLDKAYSE